MSAHSWEVKAGAFVTDGGSLMQASCAHRKRGACGGCYARLFMFLDRVERRPADAAEFAKECSTAMSLSVADSRKKAPK